MTAERVNGILGYYDGSLDGVADFKGEPHAFVIDGDMDAESPLYRLKPLTSDQFALFLFSSSSASQGNSPSFTRPMRLIPIGHRGRR